MRTLLLLALLLLSSGALHADPQIREVQEALKEQGFYYGDADGQAGTETLAAIRRYQIRNGLEVTGKLTDETLKALKITGRSTPPAITSVPRNAPVQEEQTEDSLSEPPANRRIVESDRSFLDRNTPATPPPPQRSVVAPPHDFEDEVGVEEEMHSSPGVSGASDHAVRSLFARTPYASAPAHVRREAFLRIQRYLAEEGFYRGPIDGLPGREIQAAILSFQADAELRRTGLLDVETLAEMKMLPGRGGPFPARRTAREPSRRVYRGIWIR